MEEEYTNYKFIPRWTNYFEISIATHVEKEISKCLEDLQIRD